MLEQNKKRAAALKYSENDNAPQVIASGKNVIADKILEAAKKSGVPVYENAALAESLTKLNIGQEIPREMYEIVAHILAFVAELDDSRIRKYVK